MPGPDEGTQVDKAIIDTSPEICGDIAAAVPRARFDELVTTVTEQAQA